MSSRDCAVPSAACGRRSAAPRRRRARRRAAAALFAVGLMQVEIGAHHRRHRQRHDERDQHRRRQHHRELVEEAPDDAAHQGDRQEHRRQRQAHRQHGEAHLACALKRGLEARHAVLDMAGDVLQHHDGVVDHEAGRHRQRHQRQIVERIAQEVHCPERPDQRQRHGDGRNDRGAPVPQEQVDDEHHQQDRQDHRALHVAQRILDRAGAVDGDGELDGGRQRGLQLRQHRLHLGDGLDDIGTRRAEQDHQDGGLAVRHAEIAHVLDAVAHHRDVAQPHRRVVAIGHDQRLVLGRRLRGVVDIDLEALGALLHRALGRIGVGRRQRGAHVFEPDAVFEQGPRVELDAHRGQRAAGELYLADAVHGGELLLQDVRRRVVDLPRRQRVRGQRQDQHRRRGRVELAVGRVGFERGRKIGARGIDRRLHVARGTIDVAVEAELQRDARRTDRTGRGHLVDIGDHAQMALQGRRHAGRDRLWAGAGHRGLYEDRGDIDVGQRRDGQQEKSHPARQRQSHRQQRRRDRAADEDVGEAHAGCARRRARQSRICEPRRSK